MDENLKEKILFSGSQFSVVEIFRELDNKIVKRDLILRPDGVVIIPIDNDGNIYLLSEFCAGAENPVISLPGGKVDNPFEIEKEALRELYEETGLTTSTLIPLHKTYSTPSIMRRRLYIFLALNLKYKNKKQVDSDIDILNIIKMPIDDAIELLQEDFVTDSTTLGYVLLAKYYIEKEIRK